MAKPVASRKTRRLKEAGPQSLFTYENRDIEFDDVLDDIHTAIGCTKAKEKPTIGYKIEGMPVKADPISLTCEDDWEGLCDDVLAKQDDKNRVFKVSIIVDSEYLEALNKWVEKKKEGEGKKAKSGNGKKDNRKGGKKMQKAFTFDSDSNNGSDSNDEGGNSIMEKESCFISELTTTYGNCTLCKPKICKIGHGVHVQLTFNMRAAWAAALAHEEKGVTLITPPKTELFRAFHHSVNQSPPQSTAPADLTTPAYGSSMTVVKEIVAPLIGAFAAVNQFSNQCSTAPDIPTPSRHSHRPSPPPFDIPSSDGFDELDINPYPTIEEFFRSLDIIEPQRNLSRYVTKLTALDFYCINNIAALTLQALQDDIGMTLGNAMHVSATVNKKVHAVDKAWKKQGHARLYEN
ncbi:hypothetical protein GGU11DRAFT_761214 [Lentinula aff. detonsa]|nr:hypothetical protein GGU11DRAFT_761214 [Lentinula aff. detonsa]